MKKFNKKNDILINYIDSEKPTFFDIGANKGQSAKAFLSIFPSSIIYMFEPDNILIKKLNQDFNSNCIYIHENAISNINGKKLLNMYSNKEYNSFYEIEDYGYYASRKVMKQNTLFVNCITIDYFVDKNKISKIDFLKIDTQGHSLEVLEGCKKTLESQIISILQIEINFASFYKKNESLLEILNYLDKFNYKLFTIVNCDSEEIGNFFYDFQKGNICSFDLIVFKNDLFERSVKY